VTTGAAVVVPAGVLPEVPVGAALAVVRRDALGRICEVAELGRGDRSRRYPLASVTKLLTAYAVLVAVEEGAVELDEPAGPPGATVRHLLAHASGLGFEGSAPVTRVGGRRIYSNEGFELLAGHLTAATGLPFDRYLAEAVCEPLGLRATSLDGSAAYGAVSTTADLAVFAGELLGAASGRDGVLAAATGAELVQVQFPGLAGVLPGVGRFDPLDWGLGVEHTFGRPGHWAGRRLSTAAVGHFGRSGTFLWADPVAGVACVYLGEQPFGPWARQAWPVLGDAVLAATASRPTRSASPA